MESVLRYRSQEITAAQVEFIRQLIAAHPEATRRRLSLLLCAAWEWKQPNGARLGPLAYPADPGTFASGRMLTGVAWPQARRSQPAAPDGIILAIRPAVQL